MNIQDFILIIILLVCIVWIIKRIILCYKQISQGNDPCKGCGCNCTTYYKSSANEKKCVFIEKKNRKRLRIQKIVVPLQPQSRNKRCKREMKDWFLG